MAAAPGALRMVLAPVHREGRAFVAIAAAAAAVLFWLGGPWGWLGVAAAGLCAYFFRDPERVAPEGDGLVLSPGDGHVVAIGRALPPPELGLGGGERLRISVFLSILDVHVNRVPMGGTVRRIRYSPGRFHNAASAEASAANERNAVLIEAPDGTEVVVVQVAGLVARRIVCELREDEEVYAGQRLGIIRFGSRMDLYVPPEARILVREGQTMIGGESPVAVLPGGAR